MDTISKTIMQQAAQEVELAGHGLPFIHTVTIMLNGATGGAEVIIHGFTSDQLDEALTVTRQIR